MSQPVEGTGKTVEEAIDNALRELGATEDEVEIQILSEGGPRGIFGRKVDAARVRVKLRDERSPEDLYDDEEDEEDLHDEPELQPGATAPELLEQAEAGKQFVEGLLAAMGLEGAVTSFVEDGTVHVEIGGAEMGLLIGRRGMTLEALQELVRAAVQRKTATRPRVNLDIEGYRARQRQVLERKARDAAARVRRSRRPVSLEPMSAFQRKVVHDTLTRFDGVATSSEGDEPNRRVVIRPQGDAGRPNAGHGGSGYGRRPPSPRRH